MSNLLLDAPSDIVASVLVLKNVGTSSDANQQWPVFVEDEPDSPDNAITVYTTGSSNSGRSMTDGEQQEEFTFQIRVRSQNFSDGWTKSRQIARMMDEDCYLLFVTIGNNTYRVQCVSRRGGILSLGKEYPESQRSLFTINAQVSVRLYP